MSDIYRNKIFGFKALRCLLALMICCICFQADAAFWDKDKDADKGQDKKAIGVEQLPKNKFRVISNVPATDSSGLFVGVNKFDEDKGLATLNCAVNDAVEQAHVFVRELKLIPAKNCILCLSGSPTTDITRTQLKLLKKEGVEISKATKSRILQSLRIVTRVPSGKKDMVVVSFSTHGFEDKQGVYVMPADGLRSFLSDTAIYSGTLKDSVSKSKAGKRLLILDACRERVEKNKSGGSGKAMTDKFKSIFASSVGFATLMSCDVGQFSYEDPDSGHGVFTNYLIKALRGGARPDSRGFITVGGISQYISGNVRRWMIRNKPEVADENIPNPWLGGPEMARAIPLAIASDISESDLSKARKHYEQDLSGADYFKDTPNQTVASPKIPDKVTPSPGDIMTNSIGMKLVYIPAGEFMMGSNGGGSNEKPVHKVRISQGFYMGQCEVTQGQYRAVMGKSPSSIKGDNNPVETVSWDDATEFCRKLSEKEGQTYTLPSEAQWEYACRAGTSTVFSSGNSESSLGDYAWYGYKVGKTTHPVGTKKPNDFGLYDMHGNVWEWCSDWYGGGYYSGRPDIDPQGPDTGSRRVLRGGSLSSSPWICRSAYHYRGAPGITLYDLGFRVVMEVERKVLGSSNAGEIADIETAEVSRKSFVSVSDQQFYDRKLGIVWFIPQDLPSMNWEKAGSHSSALDVEGHNDWRLPSLTELLSLWMLKEELQVKDRIRDGFVWAREIRTDYKEKDARVIMFPSGKILWLNRTQKARVVAVRDTSMEEKESYKFH